MLKTMYDAPGIGLAAIQVGEPRRIITIDVAREEEEKTPALPGQSGDRVELGGRALDLRGRLPLDPRLLRGGGAPGEGARALSRLRGKPQEQEVEGLLATCVQHEIDHLNGVLFIDYLSKLKRDLVVKKFTKAAREKERQRQHRI